MICLGALNDNGEVTPDGRRLADFPIDMELAKMLVTSVQLKCSDEMLTIVAMLSIQNVFFKPRKQKALAEEKIAKFKHADGDQLTLLNVYNEWRKNNFSDTWCQNNFVQAKNMREAKDIRERLVTIMQRNKLLVASGNVEVSINTTNIRKSICSGYFRNVAIRDVCNSYVTVDSNQVVYIHPSSVLFKKMPLWQVTEFLSNYKHIFLVMKKHFRIIYKELKQTSKKYIHGVTSIDHIQWIVEVAPCYYKRCPISEKIIKKSQNFNNLLN